MKIFISTLLCLLFIAGCSPSPKPKASPFDSKLPETEAEAKAVRRKQEKRKSGSSVNIEKLQTKEDKTPDAVQVFWLVPQDKVDGYIVNYGFTEDNLDNQKTLNSDEIEIVEDQEQGLKYRIVIEDVPADQILYLSLTAFTGEIFAQPTDILIVNPE